MEGPTAASDTTKTAGGVNSSNSKKSGSPGMGGSGGLSSSRGPKTPSGKNDSERTKSGLPPTVITVDTSKGDGEHPPPSAYAAEAEGRTPKHANKAPTSEQRTEPERAQSDHHHQGAFFPPRPFEGRMGGGPTGAFQPHPRSTSAQHHGPMQVSPGSARYYANFPGPGPYPQGQFDRNAPEYQPRSQYGRQPHPGMFPPPYQQQGGFGQPQQHPWGPPPQFHGRPPPYPPHGMVSGQFPQPPNQPHPPQNQQQPQQQHAQPSQQQQQQPQNQQQQQGNGAMSGGDGAFSRAVSSSFDRSVKSRSSDDKVPTAHPMEQEPPPAHYQQAPMGMNGDGGSVSDDGSWKQLNQIQSVDEEEMRKRISDKGDATPPADGKSPEVKQANSNSSSLTNSPTEGVEKKTVLPGPPKMTSSLDSLASVSSAQAPMKTAQEDKLMSPADASLDLMKCSSGSSALLLPPANQGGAPGSSPPEAHKDVATKRAHDDGQGEPASGGQRSEHGRRPVKKVRSGSMDEKKSPLSIACSPSADHHDESKEKSHGDHQFESKDSYYDKPLSYSYSLESVGARNDFPPMMTRPQSSASSTGTPMQVVPPSGERDAPSRQGVTQLPSWDINGQDSFGAHSTGNPLTSNFSFSHDYSNPTPSTGSEPPPPPPPPPPAAPQQQAPRYSDRPMESRNQSFDSGHYHGSFSRAETMSFESRGQGSNAEQRQGYQGHFPPHAPSWGSAGSYPHPSGYAVQPPQYRMTMQPMIMRSFSQESEQHRMNAFQPPSEFQAPPTNITRNRPRKETHILTTPFEPSKSGVFGWTKEEDMRLTEIMKKYKNPRDWEPIAKELDRNRSAKECHERWIRYLKPGVRKGQWTDQEDAIVMEAVTSSKEQPFTRWSDLAQRLPGRVGKQIRDRWVNHLNPNINHLPFSKEDDLLLWEGHQKVGKRWVEIATKFFKGSRSENHIKNRWYSASFKKFISNEFGAQAYNSKGGLRSPKKDPKKKQGKRDTDEDPTFSVGV